MTAIHTQGDAAVRDGAGCASRLGALNNGWTDMDVIVLTGSTRVGLGAGEGSGPDSARAIHAVVQVYDSFSIAVTRITRSRIKNPTALRLAGRPVQAVADDRVKARSSGVVPGSLAPLSGPDLPEKKVVPGAASVTGRAARCAHRAAWKDRTP